MKIILTLHFCKRYRERVGPLSEELVKRRIMNAVRKYDRDTLQAKFIMGEFEVLADRAKHNPDCWKAITIVRNETRSMGRR